MIGVDLAGDGLPVGVDSVCPDGGRISGRWRELGGGLVERVGTCLRFGGAKV